MFRQGDLLLLLEDYLPEGYKDKDTKVVLLGEATGHAHRLKGEATVMYKDNQEDMIRVSDKSELVHEEHDTIELDEGIYRVRRQREFDGERIRYVYD